jgi:hypothetical protein
LAAGNSLLTNGLADRSSDLFRGVSLDANLGNSDLASIGPIALGKSNSVSVEERAVSKSEGVLAGSGVAVEDSLEVSLSEAVVVLGDFVEEFSGVHGL